MLDGYRCISYTIRYKLLTVNIWHSRGGEGYAENMTGSMISKNTIEIFNICLWNMTYTSDFTLTIIIILWAGGHRLYSLGPMRDLVIKGIFLKINIAGGWFFKRAILTFAKFPGIAFIKSTVVSQLIYINPRHLHVGWIQNWSNW